VEESDKIAQTLGRFWKVTGTVSYETGEIALQEVFIQRADGIALSLYPLGKLLSGTQETLDTTRGISCVVQGGGEGIQVWPQRTPRQLGNHTHPYKGVFEHGLLLFLRDGLEKEKDRTSGSCRVG
jgi:hypothetical protein